MIFDKIRKNFKKYLATRTEIFLTICWQFPTNSVTLIHEQVWVTDPNPSD